MSFNDFPTSGIQSPLPFDIMGETPHVPPQDEKQLEDAYADNLQRVVDSLRPFAPSSEDGELFGIAQELLDIGHDEERRQSLLDLKGEERLGIHLPTQVRILGQEKVGTSSAARRLIVFGNAKITDTHESLFTAVEAKGPSISLGSEYYKGNWAAKRKLKEQVLSLLVDPDVLNAYRFTNDYPTWRHAIRTYKIDDGGTGQAFSIVRDTSYADLVHKVTGEPAEIRERSRFSIAPGLLSPEMHDTWFTMVQNLISDNGDSKTMQFELKEFADRTLETALLARKLGKLGVTYFPSVFPVSTVFPVLSREKTAA